MSKLQPQRFRDYGFTPGLLKTGQKNLISDVKGVKVGHVTKIKGQDCRTGVTLIDPGVSNLFKLKLPAATAVGNGYGKPAGFIQIEELGTLETPIALTNTLAVGPVMRGVVDLVAGREKIPPLSTINAVVGEVNDSVLNNIYGNSIQPSDVRLAHSQLSTNFDLGSVGAGTGSRAFSWKGGIGSASRRIQLNGKTYTVGALVQTNFGGSLTIMGVPIGQILGKDDFSLDKKLPDGSCMIVLATDSPLSARQLKRLANRGLLGLVRTGSIMAGGSGDFCIAFSTSRNGLETVTKAGLADEHLDTLFLAAVEAVEESVYDALFSAETVSGQAGQTLERLPIEEVVNILRKKL